VELDNVWVGDTRWRATVRANECGRRGGAGGGFSKRERGVRERMDHSRAASFVSRAAKMGTRMRFPLYGVLLLQ
jgi:hypothetical protein